MKIGRQETENSQHLKVRFASAVGKIEEAFKTVQMTHLEGASGYQEIADMGMAAIPLMAERMREIVKIEDKELEDRGYNDPNRAFYWLRVFEKIINQEDRKDQKQEVWAAFEKFTIIQEATNSFREQCVVDIAWFDDNKHLFD